MNPWWNFWLAMLYWFGETAYFGWNFLPKSGAEMACDGIALLLIIYTADRIADRQQPMEASCCTHPSGQHSLAKDSNGQDYCTWCDWPRPVNGFGDQR